MKFKIMYLFVAMFACTNINARIVLSGNCGKNGDNVTFTVDDQGLLKIEGSGEMANYSHPYDYSSRSYETTAPWRYASISEVQIADGITCIGSSSFYNKYISSIIIPSSVTSILESSFGRCNNLTSLKIPDSVVSIGEGAFADCINLKSVNIPNSIINIGSSAFSGCRSLTTINIPSSIKCIPESIFKGGARLESIDIPGSITEIENYAFEGCYNLATLKIPNSVTRIGYRAFANCM